MNRPSHLSRAHRARRILLAGITASSLLLSGCFSQGSGSKDSGEPDTRITVSMMRAPSSGLSPLSDDAFMLANWSAVEGLTQLDDNGIAEPLLATEWKQLSPTSWEFTLRDGVSFHDGEELNADAVVTALTRASEASPLPRVLNGLDLQVTNSSEGDVEKVTLTTAKPAPLLPERLSSPQLSIFSPKAYGDSVDAIGHGTGPFELESLDGVASATLVRFEDYWGDKAEASGIDVSFVPDATARSAALRTGSSQVVEGITTAQVGSIDADLIKETPQPRATSLYLNTKSGPLADPSIRAAARAALDKQPFVDDIYDGRADKAEYLFGEALPWAGPLHTPLSLPAAGTVPAGTTITIATYSDRGELPEALILAAQQLEAAGFTVKQEVREYQSIEQDALDGKFDAFLLSRAFLVDSGDPASFLSSDFTCEGSYNISQFCDPKVDALIEEASSLPAGEQRQQLIVEAEEAILNEDAVVPLVHQRLLTGVNGATGVALDPFARKLITAETKRQ